MVPTGEAARILGSSRQHIVDMCTRGELPFTWVGRHRRIDRSDLDQLLHHEHPPLTRDQERSLWLHRALVGRLVEQPEHVLNQARHNATQLLEQQQRRGMTTYWLTEWLRVLDGGADEVAEVLTSTRPHAVELRQNSPFAGVLPQDTRAKVLTAFIRHWRADHTPTPGASARELVDS
ncbi:MAG TPA: helix-turn-helix domain-containing protein [Pseudonocardia sp.]|jgi:excisionase family DNA binding protein|nr:helix-turn-helix domain-containing protein [Pseudonocardia sp.]